MKRTANNSLCPPEQSALTLVEVLLIVALVMILAALIYPAIKSITEKKQSILCMGNLRQIGQLLMLYTQDNGGKLPHAYSAPMAWYTHLWPYAGRALSEGATLYDFPFLQCPKGTQQLYDYAYDYDLSNRPYLEACGNLYYGAPVTGRRWLVIDGEWYFLRRSDGYSGAAGTKRAALRHGGRANVLFPDCSVQSMSLEEINQSLYIFNQYKIPE